MKENLRNFLMNQTKPYIQDKDLITVLKTGADSRYSVIKRAKKEGMVTPLKKGLYIIEKPYCKDKVNLFEIAQLLYGPSHISLESALSYHQWIPEGVYTITCVTPLRHREFNTHLGLFSFLHVPIEYFYLGVTRIASKNEIFFIADPWRSLADYLYVNRKSWDTIKDISMDLRVELETMLNSNIDSLRELSQLYPSPRVRKQLKIFLKELEHASE